MKIEQLEEEKAEIKKLMEPIEVDFEEAMAEVNEIKEETGFDAEIVRLIAIYDKQRHPHPPEPYYIYKLMFHCRVTGGKLRPGFDMLGADWFSLDELPPLSEPRILESQLHHLFTLVKDNIQEVYSD